MKLMTPSTIPVMLCSLIFLSGCSTTGLNFGFASQKQEKETSTNLVEQVVPVWQEAEGPGIDQQSVSRGFNGQIYFITNNRGLPSEVTGKVRIYVFDDQGAPEEVTKPIHQFDFEPDAWKTHLNISKLGPAYSVFIPYTRPGYHTAQCSLRIRYTPANGAPVFSDMVALTLPGASDIKDIPDESTKVVIPELSKRSQPALRKVTQVSANGELIHQKSVQTAGYESPAGQHHKSGRVRLSDHEAAPASSVRHAFMGEDEQEDDLYSDSDNESRTDEPHTVPPLEVDEADVSAPSEYDDADQTVRTYTIQLDD